MILPDRDRAIRDLLLAFSKSIPAGDLTPTLEPAATRLVTEDAFAFILAVSLDRGTRAEIIWTIPYWLHRQIGHLDPKRMSHMTTEQLAEVMKRLPRKPRYLGDAPRTILEMAQMVANEFGGNAELLWRGRTAQEVENRLRMIHGIGEGIASMAVILLERCRGVRFPDWSSMNVKPDVHVQRVLYRLGVTAALSEVEAIRAAARLNPDYPGALDPPLWVIGRRWCKETSPNCADCKVSALCAKVGV